jgi:uncharacterized membrane protein YfhO
MGAAWFVKQIQLVKGPAEEIKALDNFNPRETAIFDSKTQQLPAQPRWDSSASITVTKYNNDTIVYATNAASNQFAVFSEVYYPAGWNAYIDGRKTDYYKVNYVLRGMPVPVGKHVVSFIFEPQVYKTSYQIAWWSITLMYILVIGGIAISIFKKKKE